MTIFQLMLQEIYNILKAGHFATMKTFDDRGFSILMTLYRKRGGGNLRGAKYYSYGQAEYSNLPTIGLYLSQFKHIKRFGGGIYELAEPTQQVIEQAIKQVEKNYSSSFEDMAKRHIGV